MSTRRARGSGPKRGPNLTKNAYIFWNDCPVPCGDVVNYKKILDDTAHLKKGDTVAVTLAKERVKQGTVLELGSERKLKRLRFDRNGNLCTGAGIPCRRECELRQKVSFRRGVVQSEADQNLLQNVERSSCLMTGVTVTPPLPPFTMTELLQHVAALHPVPSPEEVQAVLSRLPCLAASSAADVFLVVGINIFVNSHILASYHRLHQHQPGTYLSLLLQELVPLPVMRLPYITARGKGPTKLGLPKDLYKAITVYMDHRSKGYTPVNGWANSINGIINNVRHQGGSSHGLAQ